MDPSCITANPDISGIGVRTAIYAQNLLCFIPVVAYLWDGTVSRDEMKGIKDQSISMLAIAFAILISTIIQATTAVEALQITRFHVAVILDLSWMNNTGTWIWFLLYAHRLSKADEGGQHRRPIPATWSAWTPVIFSSRHVRDRTRRALVFHIVDRAWDLFSQAPVLILGSFHLALMAAIGIWLWLDPVKFGTTIPCDPTLTIVGGAAPFSSRTLRVFSLAMYFLLLVPGINLLPPIFFFLALHIAYNRSRQHNRGFWDRCIRSIRRKLGRKSRPEPVNGGFQKVHTAFLVVGLVLLVFINIIFLVDIELTLSRNKRCQLEGEDLWGFGQVLALLLLVLPLRDAWMALQDIRRGQQERTRLAELELERERRTRRTNLTRVLLRLAELELERERRTRLLRLEVSGSAPTAVEEETLITLLRKTVSSTAFPLRARHWRHLSPPRATVVVGVVEIGSQWQRAHRCGKLTPHRSIISIGPGETAAVPRH